MEANAHKSTSTPKSPGPDGDLFAQTSRHSATSFVDRPVSVLPGERHDTTRNCDDEYGVLFGLTSSPFTLTIGLDPSLTQRRRWDFALNPWDDPQQRFDRMPLCLQHPDRPSATYAFPVWVLSRSEKGIRLVVAPSPGCYRSDCRALTRLGNQSGEDHG